MQIINRTRMDRTRAAARAGQGNVTMKVRLLRKFLNWRAIAGGILAGGIVHILVTLAIPYYSPKTPFRMLAATLPLNQMTIAPATTSRSQLLPYMTPQVRHAFCRYDIHRGPVRISARLLDPSWTLAFYTPQGDNFHTVTGLATRTNDVTFDLVRPADRFWGLFSFRKAVRTDRPTVETPQKTGLVVLRAPVNGTAFTSQTVKALELARCTLVDE